MKQYVWLNMNTGKFSNSWDEETIRKVGGIESLIEDTKEGYGAGWKLIEYTCANDGDFEFYNLMKIVTNKKQ